MKELQIIQSRLKVPKDQFNSFGKYKYRSCESILEALKPLLEEQNCYLTISDKIVLIGERYYVEATAHIYKNDWDGGAERTIDYESAIAYAREPADKKGMDLAQLTGATSSYARKYALNGLFAIDDTKDADTMKPPAPAVKLPSRASVNKSLQNAKTKEEVGGIQARFLAAANGIDNVLDSSSGKQGDSRETWADLFDVHFNRVNGVSPLNAKETDEQRQFEFNRLCDNCADKETLEQLRDNYDANPSLQNDKNQDTLLSLGRDFE